MLMGYGITQLFLSMIAFVFFNLMFSWIINWVVSGVVMRRILHITADCSSVFSAVERISNEYDEIYNINKISMLGGVFLQFLYNFSVVTGALAYVWLSFNMTVMYATFSAYLIWMPVSCYVIMIFCVVIWSCLMNLFLSRVPGESLYVTKILDRMKVA